MSDHLARLLTPTAARAPRPVRVHIEQLSVVGLPMTPAQSRQFGSALALELRQLAREPGWPADTAGRVLPGVLAPTVAVPAGGSPTALGREVARSLFDALRGLR